MLLFIQSLLEGDYPSLKIKLAIVAIMWMFVFISITIDLRSGYAKAKRRGEARTSSGLKRTVSKFTLYYSGLLFAFMIDAIIMYVLTSFSAPVPVMPYITVIGSLYLIYVEARSVLEKAEDKGKARLGKNLSDLLTMLENREDVSKAMSEIIRNNQTKDDETHA